MKVPAVIHNADLVEDIPAGTVIFEAPSVGDCMYGIIQGQVEIRMPHGGVRCLGPDDTFGEVAIIDSAPRSATAVAMSDTRFAIINRRTFQFLVHETPMFVFQVMSSIAERLRSYD
jgi:CRP/FNR family transcriptional regulator, cyclic AMP receptor protein